MKRNLLCAAALAVAFSLVACEDSTSANTNGIDCHVTKSETSVRVDMTMEGYSSYREEMSLQNGSLYFESEEWYASASEAAYACDEAKMDADTEVVTCSGNSIFTSDRMDNVDESGFQRAVSMYESLCDEF